MKHLVERFDLKLVCGGGDPYTGPQWVPSINWGSQPAQNGGPYYNTPDLRNIQNIEDGQQRQKQAAKAAGKLDWR